MITIKQETRSMDSTFDINVETELEEKGNEVITPFDPKSIRTEVTFRSLDFILKKLKRNEISFYADYQRRPDLWNDVKKSLLIESLLLQLPISSFYFEVLEDERWEVIDGLQRLSALNSFIVKEELRLRGLEYLTQYEGIYFSQLHKSLIRSIDETQIMIFLIQRGTPDDVKFNLFKRINTGGLILNAQEMRHALHAGIPTNFIKQLGDVLIEVFDTYLYKISKEKQSRQEHCDYATRFLAFYLLFYLKKLNSYKPELDNFLSSAMKAIKDLSEQQRLEIKVKFKDTLHFIFEVLGKHVFRKAFNSKNLMNKALFEVLTVQFACCSESDLVILKCNKDRLIEKLKDLYESSQEFEKSISTSTGSVTAVTTRHTVIRQVIQEVLNS